MPRVDLDTQKSSNLSVNYAEPTDRERWPCPALISA